MSATKKLEKRECMKAFKQGIKHDAEKLLLQIERPADIRTVTIKGSTVCQMVSLLHLAADHGWMDTIIDLITKYKCDTNCKDSHGLSPLHYAVINNHLEVVRYLINEQHCDPSTNDSVGSTLLHYACSSGPPVKSGITESSSARNSGCQNFV